MRVLFFFYRAEDLPHVLYCTGLLAVLRSKSKRGKPPINVQMYILLYQYEILVLRKCYGSKFVLTKS
jgi:hypothetical protein